MSLLLLVAEAAILARFWLVSDGLFQLDELDGVTEGTIACEMGEWGWSRSRRVHRVRRREDVSA